MKKAITKLSAMVLAAVMLCSCGTVKETETEIDKGTGGETETVVYNDSYSDVIRDVRTENKERSGRPTKFTTGNTFEDLIFYDEDSATAEEKMAALPEGTVIIDISALESRVSSVNGSYGSAKVVEVVDSDVPFDKAVEVTVDTVPPAPYNFQFNLGGTVLSGKVKAGEALLVSFYARCVEGDKGQLGVVIEENGGAYDKLLSVVADADYEWRQFFYPVIYKAGYTSVSVRLGYGEQVIEVGGFSIVNYGDDVSYEELPVTSAIASLAKGAEWRREAFDRIEAIRKGDFKIVVTDTYGNLIEGAKVEIEMFEHEFEWGCAVNQRTALTPSEFSKISSIFNSAVLENELKWALYEKNSTLPETMINTLAAAGIDTVRGHCLVWDRVRRDNDTSVPTDLPGLYNDREAMTRRIRTHIEEVLANVKGIAEWDVLNEACTNTVMQDIYGRELIAEWFAMARAADPDMKLYYNDYITSEKLFELLDLMEELNVDYDGIGIQSHYSNVVDMENLQAFYERLAKYGKELKITEYDFACQDPELQASFTRDLLILAFSIEAMEGVYLWGLIGGENDRYVGYDSKGKPRLALEQIKDLLYNKWWTVEEGRTDVDGEVSFNGYYGSYNISVTAFGTKQIVSVDCFRDSEREIRIVMP